MNGAYYKITVSADGQSVDTSKVESPQTGTLTVACDCLDLGLCSEDGGYRVFGGRTKLELPASDYIVTGYRLVKKDARGDLWTINGYTSAISQGRLAIKTGETENLKVGAPVVVKASVSPIQAGVVTIGFSLLGASGEPLESGALKNGVRQPAPQIKIVASDSGKVLSQGSFGYT